MSEPREAADVLVQGNPESRGGPVGNVVNVNGCGAAIDIGVGACICLIHFNEACNFMHQSRMIY